MSTTTDFSKGIDASVINAIIEDATDPSIIKKPKKKEVKEIEIEKFKLIKGKESFLSHFIFSPKPDRDHNVTVFKKTDWKPVMQDMIPIVNKNYVWQPQIELFAVAMEEGDTVMISGPTGSGKSTMVEQFCAQTKRPFIRINMTGDMESSSLFGQLTVEDGATVWVDGPVTEAVRHGGVVLIDEWEFCPPEITYGLQRLLEDNPELMLKEMPAGLLERKIKPHKEFRLVMGGNTLGQGDVSGEYAGAQVQSNATLDRYMTTIHLGYLPKNHETKVLKKAVPKLPADTVKQMLQFASFVRTGHSNSLLSMTMSPRTLINWGKKIIYWGDPVVALNIAYFDKVAESERPEVQKLIKKVFGG